MNQTKLENILEKHKKWLNNEPEGERAILRGASLRGKDMEEIDLRGADMQGADMRGNHMRGADFRCADMLGVDMDFSSLPLCCGSLWVHFDDRQIIQQLYHVVRNTQYSRNVSQEIKDCLLTDELIALANRFHRVNECGEIVQQED